jgi:divalent metal cation (Fe/Co/Zn/Cd) transporter
MDTLPGKALNEQIRELAIQVPGVQAIDSVKAHRFGQYLVINLAIFVDGAISVDEGDAISDHVEKALVDGIDYVRAVHVHFHSKVGTQV